MRNIYAVPAKENHIAQKGQKRLWFRKAHKPFCSTQVVLNLKLKYFPWTRTILHFIKWIIHRHQIFF